MNHNNESQRIQAFLIQKPVPKSLRHHLKPLTYSVFGQTEDFNGKTPIAGCFMMDNPIYKWMMTGGTPISGNLQLYLREFFNYEVLA